VLGYLLGRGAPFLVLPGPNSYRAEDTAARHGVDPREVVKIRVMVSRSGTALMVIPQIRALDIVLARIAMGDADARIAPDEDVARRYPDLSPDALPPLGLFLHAPMYVDTEVLTHRNIVFAAGRASLAICMATKDLFRDDPIAIATLTAASDAARRAADDAHAQRVPVDLAG
jgi:prolyl-tRNA editing enzyme YbaK/EbsC (Cys-tRNA(Pro) deacylase)